MKKSLSMMALTMLMASALLAAEDWRGDNRLAGYLVDKNTGKPVAGAKLMLRSTRGSGPDITADNNGKWAVLGLCACGWNIDIEAPGYEPRKIGPVGISEGQRLPPMKIEMEPVVVQQTETAAPAQEVVKIGGVAVSKDITDAVEAGNQFLGEQKFKEAVDEYEKAYPTLSSNISLKFALARAYYGAGQLKKAIVLLDEAYKADPSNTQAAVLLANMFLEDGQLEKGKQIIDALPPTALNLDTLLNTGIALMNKKQPAAAYEYFSKAVALSPDTVDGYYYRGLSSIQMGKVKQARPDLEKVVAIGGDAGRDQYVQTICKSQGDVTTCESRLKGSVKSMADEAKEYLKSIK